MSEALRVGCAVACLSFLTTTFGCSSSSGGGGGAGSGDVSIFCQKAVSCGAKDPTGQPFTQANCEAGLQGWIPPAGCAAAVQNASCSDLNAPVAPPSIKSACYPACNTTDPATCSADQSTITKCEPSGQFTFDCGSVCTRTGKTYSGVCAATYSGQKSSTGQPVCWCK